MADNAKEAAGGTAGLHLTFLPRDEQEDDLEGLPRGIIPRDDDDDDEPPGGALGGLDLNGVDMSSWKTDSFNSFRPVAAGGGPEAEFGHAGWPAVTPGEYSGWSGYGDMPMFPGMPLGMPMHPWSGLPPPSGQHSSASELEARAAELELQATQLKMAARQAKMAAQQARSSASPMMIPEPGGYAGSALIEDPLWMPSSAAPGLVPKEKYKAKTSQGSDSKAVAASSANKAERSTIMLRNIPNNYTREMVLELLDNEGFRGCYDFVYLPMDFHRMAGLGYSFVNLVTPEAAERAYTHFQGFKRWSLASQKVGEVSWGEPLQGLEAHIERYRNSPVMHEEVPDKYKPILFKDGVRVEFPPPTKRIRAPRVKRTGGKSGEAGDVIDAVD